MPVVVLDIHPQDLLQVTTAGDQRRRIKSRCHRSSVTGWWSSPFNG
jgi:hypothetical protein